MPKKFHLFPALIALLAVALACANPVGGTAPKQPANVETAVAATIQALTAAAPEAVTAITPPQPATATPSPEPSSLLPHSMYFLNKDSARLVQVYRLEKDGKTVKQITFEPAKVDYYDVSSVDGSVVYVTNNQMFMVKADGSNRSMIVDGGAINPNSFYVNGISVPLWSPDGQTITYGYHGINIYSIVDGQSTLVREDQLKTENGFTFGKVNMPISYSPDGSKLLVGIVTLNSDVSRMAIFTPENKSLVRLIGDEVAFTTSNVEWTADDSAFYVACPSAFSPGLWRVDSASGAVTTLLNGDLGNGTVNFSDAPLLAPDGQLYYFFASQTTTDVYAGSGVHLQLVRSAPDGVTARTILRPETYQNMNEALWAPDASFVIVVLVSIPEDYPGGAAQLVYTDGQKGVISLLPFAMEMKWGP
jgi:Tol biopolymer transport system component